MLKAMQVIAEDGGRKNWPYPSNFTCPAGRSCHSHMLLFAPHTCCVLPFKIWVLHISQKALLAPLYYPPPFPHFQPFQTGSRTCDPWIWNVLWDHAEALREDFHPLCLPCSIFTQASSLSGQRHCKSCWRSSSKIFRIIQNLRPVWPPWYKQEADRALSICACQGCALWLPACYWNSFSGL